jgi:hypothetical protein
MIFNRKKKMVDIRELQKRGVVRIPRNDITVPTNSDGFVELGTNSETTSQKETSNSDFFGFTDMTSSTPTPQNSFSTETDGYDKREVDEKITNLDNKVYKLENRIELLERKLQVNQPSDTSVGPMGW